MGCDITITIHIKYTERFCNLSVHLVQHNGQKFKKVDSSGTIRIQRIFNRRFIAQSVDQFTKNLGINGGAIGFHCNN